MKKIRKLINSSMVQDGFERNDSASITFCLVGLFVLIFQFMSPNHKLIYMVSGALIFAINLVRYRISKRFFNGSISDLDREHKTLQKLIFMTSLVWGLTLVFVFYNNPVVSISGILALAMTTGIAAGAVTSLAVFPNEQNIFFILTQIVPSLVMFYNFYNHQRSEEGLIGTLMFFCFFYFYKQSKKVREMIVDSYIHRFQLEEEQDNLQTTLFELKKTQDELLLEKSKSLNAERLASVGAFASGVAHEINNPLAILNAHVFKIEQIVKKKNDDKLSSELLPVVEKITQTNYRISEIIKGLRNFANEESEKEPESIISAVKLIESSLLFTKEKIKNTGVNLTIGLIPSVELYVQNTRMIQALFHIIKNAFEAVKDSDPKQIEIRFIDDPNFFKIYIEDSGKGIPAKNRDQIFDPFFTTKEVGQGTGLGLSIARGIIEGQDGQLSLLENSTRTCFEISLRKNRSFRSEAS